MFHIIRARRLEQLEAEVLDLRRERNVLNHELATVYKFRALAEQARDFWEADAREWKGRASRFIDAVGIKSATLDAPVMETPHPAEPASGRQVMAALSVREINRERAARPESAPGSVIGVNEQAAAAAVAGVLTSS